MPDGYGFDFIIEKKGNQYDYTVSGSRSIKISHSYYDRNIQSFTVTDEDGIDYVFREGDTPFAHGESHWSFSCNVSWQLVRIDLPNSRGSITFNYDYSIEPTHIYGMEDAAVKIVYDGVGSGESVQCNFVPARQPYNYKMKLLSSISGSGFDIVFDYKNPQKQAAHNCIKKIRIEETAASIEIDLAMSENEIWPIGLLAKLDSITIKSHLASDKPQIYRCTYTDVWGFSGIDHWGFLNSGDTRIQTANFNLYVPFDVKYQGLNGRGMTAIDKSPQDPCPYYKIKLSNSAPYDPRNHREPTPPEYHGILSRLKFPTGGYTDFEFENHQFLSSTDYNGDYIHDPTKRVPTLAGGFRIKKSLITILTARWLK